MEPKLVPIPFMENPEIQTPPEKKSLDDSLKLAIREEIEKEVEKRIARQEGFYWKFLALFGGFVAVFAFALWHVQLNELPGVVQKELATQAVTQAKDKIMEIKSSVEAANQNVNAEAAAVSNVLNSVADNQQAFTNRLNEIRQQDNIVLVDDLAKLFVVQRVTNLVEGKKIILDYEPIPQTIHFTIGTPDRVVAFSVGEFSAEGNAIFVSNQSILNTINSIITNTPSFQAQYQLNVDYVRKSLR